MQESGSCPEPVIMTKNAIESNPKESIQVIVDAQLLLKILQDLLREKDIK